MHDAIERLRSLRVADAMTRHVVQIHADQKLVDVARVFREHAIAAAPVIDEQGCCVGMLSASDFLRQECVASAVDDEPPGMQEHRLVPAGGETSLWIEDVPNDAVGHCMTKTVRSVAPDELLLKAAVLMCSEHIHRLPVLDAERRVVGMISTMDIVAAIVNAIDEMDASLLEELRG